MKIILREYLSLLKESDELDKLIPNLLLSMAIPPLSHAQKGVAQAGVDVAAVGKDLETGKKSLYLFVIKRGDIGRADWDTEVQSVRQSLNQIQDVYLRSYVKPDHRKLPIKIVVCTGGGLKQEAGQEWAGYVNNHQQTGKIEYEFWGGDHLSILIEKYLFNENILPEFLRSKFRKTLALLSNPDYDNKDYYSILDEILLRTNFGDPKNKSTKNKILKAFRTVNLCQNIIYFWAKNENNLKPAIYCSERTALNAWDVIRRNDLYKSEKLISAYFELFSTLVNVNYEYVNKVHNHCRVENAFSGYSNEYSLECLTIFENLGLISTAGLLFLHYSLMTQDNKVFEASAGVKDLLKDYLNNQKATKAPCYDGHIIDISLALYLLFVLKETDFAEAWITEIVHSVIFSYHHLGRYFPIQTDSFDDLVELNATESIKKEELFQLSTLIPILAQWCVCCGLRNTYELLQNQVSEGLSSCTFQIWYPDEDTDQYLYTKDPSRQSGNMEAPIDLSISFEDMESRIKLVQDQTVSVDSLGSHKAGFEFLPILSSRHFRMPFLPSYWQALLLNQGE